MHGKVLFLSPALLLFALGCTAVADDASGSRRKEPPPPQKASSPAAAAADSREVLREKTVYVPYEKLGTVFEKEGRGIFLPYEEFLRLWTASQPPPPPPPPDIPPAAAVIRGGTYTGTVAGEVARFETSYEIEALKKGWSELPLSLKGVAVESVELSSPKALFSARNGEYVLFLPEPGRYQAKLRFSARVSQEPGKRSIAFAIPPTAVSRLDLTIPEESVRIDVKPAVAVTQTAAREKTTQVLAFLGNASDVAVSWMPPAGRVSEGGAVLLAEQAIRAHLGERTLRISTEIGYQVLRGEVDTLRVRIPAATRLLAVKGDNIREWVQEADVLVVRLHSPLKDASRPSPGGDAAAAYRLALSFERILNETPAALAVPFPRAEEVIRESGWAVLGYESGLNVRVQNRTGLSQLDRDEVPEPLRADLGVGFRYLAHPLALDLAVEKIIPSVRSSTTSVVTLGREEDVWLGWIDYTIQKAGLFRLDMRVPSRWNVATMGDPASVEDFQTSDAAGVRTIAVSLKSKAMGTFRLPFRLIAQGSAVAGESTLAPPVVVGSSEDRGLLGVSAPRSIELVTVQRDKMLPADVDELFRSGIMGQIGADAGIPLTYGYREQSPSVRLRLAAKKTEIDVLAQHLIEIADGGIKVSSVLDYDVLYAGTDRLLFSAPSSLDAALKVEAKEKKEVRKVSTAQDTTLWEILLQAPALGGVSVSVTHEMELKALESGKPLVYPVPIAHAREVRAEKGFVAIRKEGTLEIVPRETGMEAIDAGDLPDRLRRGQIYSALRYFTPDPALTLTLTKYDYQPLATTVVNLIRLTSVLSEERKLKTRAVLFVQNTERQYLELLLPPEANIFSISVAGKSQPPRKRKDGTGTLIQIPPSAGPGGTFPVVIVYEEAIARSGMGSFGSARITTPQVLEGVPASKVEYELYLPPDYAYLGFGGSLRPSTPGSPSLWSRFKRLLSEGSSPEVAVAATQAAAPPEPTAGPDAVDVELPTRGSIPRSFETMAPLGKLRFVYVGRNLFSFIDFLSFVTVLAAGVLAIRKLGWPALPVVAACVLLPLMAVWFGGEGLSEIYTSLLLGGLALGGWQIFLELRGRAREPRKADLSLEPDPYLEDAAEEPPRDAPPPAPGTAAP